MLYFINLLLFCLLAIIPLATSANAQGLNQNNKRDIKLIANSDVQQETLSTSDVKNIFLGKKIRWKSGARITFFISEEKSVHKAFLKTYIGKSAAQYQKIWRSRLFGGSGKAPKFSGNDQEMVTAVSQTSGAIGYISAGADIGKAKILSVH